MKTLLVLTLLAIAALGAGAGAGTAQADPDEPFCDLARQIGAQNLGLDTADTADTVDTATLLAGIDRLDALAPPDIADDFHYFDRFEHATLDPGSDQDTSGLTDGRTPTVLRHVATYLRETCHVTAPPA